MKTLFLLTVLAEEKKTPEAADVVAGWTGFAVFLGLIVATALLCWSFTRQIRKAKLAKEAGVYGAGPGDVREAKDQPTDH
ncbi:MAG TPA: hypothetical protein VIR30_12295 [Nocardioides sp.]|uniref:Uncharacterized protein n=1 Tax=Nocardioides daedukensis TaxID=634462 RepID=A0A7Y9UVQ7_9ACTN|nr:hypothetical protein [Nocardioides daedukensis]NYG58455.1 hypothetical protein [Nocardioides daedukensis]